MTSNVPDFVFHDLLKSSLVEYTQEPDYTLPIVDIQLYDIPIKEDISVSSSLSNETKLHPTSPDMNRATEDESPTHENGSDTSFAQLDLQNQ